MIVYHDIRKTPLFKPYFEACGVRHINHFKNKGAQLLGESPFASFLPSKMFYTKPHFPPGDDRIILFDSKAGAKYMNWICKNCPDKRIIYWFWNPVKPSFDRRKLPERVEIWTYSKRDAERYGFRYNTQFFFDSVLPLIPPEQASAPARKKPVVYFLGREKGRGEKLEEIARLVREAGAVPRFRVIPDMKKPAHYSVYEGLLVPYGDVLREEMQADVLLDLVKDPDDGLSLRPLEALFFRKKLITNCRTVLEERFYDPRNVYLLGVETRSLSEFLAEEPANTASEAGNYYLFSEWLKRFDGQSPDRMRKPYV